MRLACATINAVGTLDRTDLKEVVRMLIAERTSVLPVVRSLGIVTANVIEPMRAVAETVQPWADMLPNFGDLSTGPAAPGRPGLGLVPADTVVLIEGHERRQCTDCGQLWSFCQGA